MHAKHDAVWMAWILGVALMFLSNARLIDARIGWGGFWIALAASLVSRLPLWKTRQPKSHRYSPDEIRVVGQFGSTDFRNHRDFGRLGFD